MRTSALSLSRGNGKSTLASWFVDRLLTPGDSLFVPNTESHLVAGSLGQARRTTFKVLREFVEARPDAADLRIAESANACHVLHKPSGTKVSVLAANGKTAQGLVRAPFVIADEPGSWDVIGGQLLHGGYPDGPGQARIEFASDLHRDASPVDLWLVD